MATMVEKLTKAQEDALAKYPVKWLKIGLCTDPADRPAAEQALADAYRAAGLEPPPMVWARSPMEGARLVREKDPSVNPLHSAIYSLHDASWLASCDFYATECDLESAKRAEPLMRLAQACGWCYVYRELAVLTERPCELHRDSSDPPALHCETGPAVAYPDGWGVWAWHGVRVPRWVIEQPEQITATKVDAEQNAEVRRVMLERLGMGRYIAESDAEVVDEDKDSLGHPRKLLAKTIDGTRLLVLQVTNSTPEPDGTHRTYLLNVHPQLRPIPPVDSGKTLGEPQKLTCHNAVASTFYMRGEEWHPDMET